MVKGLERSLKQWLVRGLRELLISLKIEFATADICCSVWYSPHPICVGTPCVYLYLTRSQSVDEFDGKPRKKEGKYTKLHG